MVFGMHNRDTLFCRFWCRCIALILITCLLVVAAAVVAFRRTPDRVAVADKTECEALIVLAGANDVKRGPGAYESFYVAYNLTEQYPARNTIRQILSRLSNLGWTPLKEDWLNPGLASSHVRGWTDFLDNTKGPLQHVHQWSAQWQDSRGNIVTYSLRYSYPDGAPRDLHSLWVNGLWYPAASAKMIRSAGNR
jgi:hypothetical protein